MANSIVVDLLARTGSFETDMERAEKSTKKRTKEIQKSFDEMASTIRVSAVAAAGAVGLMVNSVLNDANEIANLSRISGAGAEEFQKFAAASRTVGIEQEKLGDIFKDFREKVGEFMQTGGGGMKDFFEQIAPKVGVTADAFKNLSGPQALQLYVDSLEKANLSQDEMSFYLESMASDTTALIPLLRNGGTELRELGDQAERTGQVMSNETIASAQQLKKDMMELNGQLSGAKNTIVTELLPALSELATALNEVDGEGSAMKTIAEGIAVVFETVAVLGLNVAYVVEQIGLEITGLGEQALAVMKFDFAEAKRIGEQMQKDAADARAKVDRQSEAILTARARASSWAALNGMVGDNTGGGSTPPGGGGGGGGGGDGPKGPKAPEYVSPLLEEAKSFAQAMEAINRAQMNAKATAEDYTATQAQLVELFGTPEFINMPETWKEAIAAQAEAQINTELAARAAAEFADQQARINDLTGRSELEKQIEDYLLLAEAMQMGKISAEEFAVGLNKIGLGEDGEDYWTKWLEGAQESLMNFDELANSVVENFSTRFGDAFEQMVFDSQNLGEAISGLAEGMARSIVNALGQMAAQWLAYQAVQLLVGKTTAASAAGAQIFEALASQQMAALNAFASTAAIPLVGPALAPAAAAGAYAATSPFVATIASLSTAAVGARQSGGPVSDGMPYLVGERGAEMFVPNTSGAIVPNHKLGGGDVTVNMIEDKRRAGQVEERQNNGKRELDVFVADIMGDGPRAKSIQKAFGLQRRGY